MDTGAPIPVVALGAVAVVIFKGLIALMFVPPNDEALPGHPLYAAGLDSYSLAEVVGSPWIARLEELNSVHPRHRPGVFGGRHIIVPFHDETFECISSDVSVHGVETGTTGAVAARVLAGLAAA